MFVGHEFLAFAIAGWGASRLGCDGPSALRVGAVAGLAALLPDLDILYAIATYAVAVADGVPLGWEAFWGVANPVHRVVTHTLPTGLAATLVFGAAVAAARRRQAGDSRDSAAGATVATVALLAVAAVVTAALLSAFQTRVSGSAAIVAVGFLTCVAGAGWIVGGRVDAPPSKLLTAAGVGFLTHPFGDVFLAVPPPLLSPFGPPVLTERVALAADPTLAILGVLFVELAAVWLGLGVFSRLTADRSGRFSRSGRLRDLIDRRAAVGIAYAPAAVFLPRPTIVDAHVLGFTIVPFAVIVGIWIGYAPYRHDREGASVDSHVARLGSVYAGIAVSVAALTIAAIAYTAVYVVS